MINFFDKWQKTEPSLLVIDSYHVPEDRAQRREEKISVAKKYLGKKWIAHPVNRIQKRRVQMQDFAEHERKRFIRSVK